MARGNLAAAQTHFEQAIQADPLQFSAHNNLAVVLWRSGLPLRALPHMEEAVRLKPDFTAAVNGLVSLRAQIAEMKVKR